MWVQHPSCARDMQDALESTLNGLSSSGAGSSSSSSSKPSVSRQLRGLSFTVPVSVGAPITSALTVVGSVTSVGQDMEGRWVGLGYVRCRTAAGEELQLDGECVLQEACRCHLHRSSLFRSCVGTGSGAATSISKYSGSTLAWLPGVLFEIVCISSVLCPGRRLFSCLFCFQVRVGS